MKKLHFLKSKFKKKIFNEILEYNIYLKIKKIVKFINTKMEILYNIIRKYLKYIKDNNSI